MAPIKPGSNNSNDWKRTITVRFPRSDGERMVRRLVCRVQSVRSPSRRRVAVAALTEPGANRLRVGKGAEYKKACELLAVGGHDLAFLSHGVGFACLQAPGAG